MRKLLNFFSRFRMRIVRRKRKGIKEPLLKSDMLTPLTSYKGAGTHEYAVKSELWRMERYEDGIMDAEYLLKKIRMKRDPRKKKS